MTKNNVTSRHSKTALVQSSEMGAENQSQFFWTPSET
jgi:hypothetical protein